MSKKSYKEIVKLQKNLTSLCKSLESRHNSSNTGFFSEKCIKIIFTKNDKI